MYSSCLKRSADCQIQAAAIDQSDVAIHEVLRVICHSLHHFLNDHVCDVLLDAVEADVFGRSPHPSENRYGPKRRRVKKV